MKNYLLLVLLFFSMELYAQNNLIIGTYTDKGNSKGIYVYDFNAQTAETTLKTVTESTNPSYLALSRDQQFIYAVTESGKTSAISSFAFEKQSGKLSPINSKASEGADPCFVAVDDKFVILANYSGGNIAVFGRNADGSLTDAKQLIQHTGKSVHPSRQNAPHVHQVQFTPDHHYLICNDLGEDLTYIYHYNPANANSILKLKTVVKTNSGSGPRHLTFSPNGKFAYLKLEMSGTITSFTYKNGSLSKIQEISTAPKDFKGKIDGADIHISADGKFLYETNRGDLNAIGVFAILSTGILKPIQWLSTLGKGPRNFTIDPSGNYLLIGQQQTNEVVIFKRDQGNGTLTDTGKRIAVGAPVCLIFTK
jgi:6-phosphogluconolactonase